MRFLKPLIHCFGYLWVINCSLRYPHARSAHNSSPPVLHFYLNADLIPQARTEYRIQFYIRRQRSRWIILHYALVQVEPLNLRLSSSTYCNNPQEYSSITEQIPFFNTRTYHWHFQGSLNPETDAPPKLSGSALGMIFIVLNDSFLANENVLWPSRCLFPL